MIGTIRWGLRGLAAHTTDDDNERIYLAVTDSAAGVSPGWIISTTTVFEHPQWLRPTLAELVAQCLQGNISSE